MEPYEPIILNPGTAFVRGMAKVLDIGNTLKIHNVEEILKRTPIENREANGKAIKSYWERVFGKWD